MKYTFTSTSKTGKGRGKFLGFPTINLVIPHDLAMSIAEGVYAAKATLKGETHNCALYYGTVPTFEDPEHTLEVYLLDVGRIFVLPGETVSVEVVKFIRGVQKFDMPELLVRQIEKDVLQIREILQ